MACVALCVWRSDIVRLREGPPDVIHTVRHGRPWLRPHVYDLLRDNPARPTFYLLNRLDLSVVRAYEDLESVRRTIKDGTRRLDFVEPSLVSR